MLQHLPPRKRLAAQMKEMQQQQQQQQRVATAVITGMRRPRENENINSMTTATTTGSLRPPGSLAQTTGPSKKARLAEGTRVMAMIPESDLIREARARAALAGGEPAVSVAAAEAKATARAKGARAVAARQAAIAKAHAAKAAAKAAEDLAALAAKAKLKAAELERERTQRKAAEAAGAGIETGTETKTQKTQMIGTPPPTAKVFLSNVKAGKAEEVSVLPPVVSTKGAVEEAVEEVKSLTDEDMARQLHMEINASPRLGRTMRGGDRNQTPWSQPTSPSPPSSSQGFEVPRRHAGPSA